MTPAIVTRGVLNTSAWVGTGRTPGQGLRFGLVQAPGSMVARAEKDMTDEQFMEICEEALKHFDGSIGELERAIGTLYVARYTGWKPIYLMQDRKSLKKYEDLLGI